MSEPIYTGPLPVQISGDIALGKTYERYGRKMLGGLLNASGAAARIANGEPGGYFTRSVRMDDGTVVTATTNDGQHRLRIDTPRPVQDVEYRREQHSASGSAPHTVFTPGTEGASPAPEVPLPPRPPEEEDEEPPPEKRRESIEYMWVGIRSVDPGIHWASAVAILIEPPSGPQYRDSGLPMRGILQSSDVWASGDWIVLDDADGGGYEVKQDGSNVLRTIDEGIADIYDSKRHSFNDAPPENRAERNIIEGTHSQEVYVDNRGAVFLVSANGLRCESIQMLNTDTSNDWTGFDPKADDQSGVGVRDFGDRGNYNRPDLPYVLWDAVWTLDPHEDEEQDPYDSRPKARAARRALEQQAGMVTRVLPGEYILAPQCFGLSPRLASIRAGEIIPIYAGEENDGLNGRSSTSDYDQYMKPIDTTTNMRMEIEVRLGKGDAETVFHFMTTIAEASGDWYAVMPYGVDWAEPCWPYGGPNPIGPNFAPEFIAIDVLGGSARWVGKDEIDLYPILGGGAYAYRGDDRKPLHIYIHVDPFSQPEQDNFAEYAGHILFRVMEAATAGVYGDVFLTDPGGESGCIALLEGASKSGLWRVDAGTMTLSACAPLGNMDDYPYGWIPDESMPGGGFQSPYMQELSWYYPYKYIDWASCTNSVAFAVTAVKGQYQFDTGQKRYFADPPNDFDCC